MNQTEFLADIGKKASGYPVAVLSRGLRTFIGSSIAAVTKGTYNHFMFLIDQQTVATQGALFTEEPIRNYMKGAHLLKFVIDTRWTPAKKQEILSAIKTDLKKPFYSRMYDYLAIFGQLIHQPWIQIPWLDICSERGKYFRLSDPEYKLKHPDPTDINRHMKKHQMTLDKGGYLVIGRWEPEDY